MDTVDEKAPNIVVVITENDMNDTNTDTEANTDGNQIPGLEKRGT